MSFYNSYKIISFEDLEDVYDEHEIEAKTRDHFGDINTATYKFKNIIDAIGKSTREKHTEYLYIYTATYDDRSKHSSVAYSTHGKVYLTNKMPLEEFLMKNFKQMILNKDTDKIEYHIARKLLGYAIVLNYNNLVMSMCVHLNNDFDTKYAIITREMISRMITNNHELLQYFIDINFIGMDYIIDNVYIEELFAHKVYSCINFVKEKKYLSDEYFEKLSRKYYLYK